MGWLNALISRIADIIHAIVRFFSGDVLTISDMPNATPSNYNTGWQNSYDCLESAIRQLKGESWVASVILSLLFFFCWKICARLIW